MKILCTILLFICLPLAISADGETQPLEEEVSSNYLLKVLRQTYRSDVVHSSSDAGSPLLLTPFIEQNKLQEAREAARVDTAHLLPGIESYAGYFTVDKNYSSNLFFWYFPVTGSKVEDAPWIIWLQGGPGASSLFGLFEEIGPFHVTNNTLKEMPYSWGKNHSLVFIDNPVGTGFSFTDDDRGYATNQTTISEQLYDALQQFLTIFSELREVPLTIAGESYAGKHIPSLGVQIHWNRDHDKPINLQGLAIGNGFTDPITLQRYSYFVREIGLVDDNTADILKEMEIKIVESIEKRDLLQAKEIYGQLLYTISKEAALGGNVYNFLERPDAYSRDKYTNFIVRDEVRKSIHVGNTPFTNIGLVYDKLSDDFMNSCKTWLEELLDNYKVLLFNGHLDIIVAYHPSVNSYNALSFSGSDEFKVARRRPWYHNQQLSGYYRVAANLTEVMVRGAGHMVPTDKPAPMLGLISAFSRGISLDRDTGDLVNVPT